MASWDGLSLVSPRLRTWLSDVGAEHSQSLADMFTDSEIAMGVPANFIASSLPSSSSEDVSELGVEFAALLRSARRWEEYRTAQFSQLAAWVPAAREEKRRRMSKWQAEEDKYLHAGRSALRAVHPPPPDSYRMGGAHTAGTDARW